MIVEFFLYFNNFVFINLIYIYIKYYLNKGICNKMFYWNLEKIMLLLNYMKIEIREKEGNIGLWLVNYL